MARLLLLALLLSGCAGLDERQRFHVELKAQTYYVTTERETFTALREGPIVGDCSDFAFAAWVRSGRACEPWYVLSDGILHAVCLWPDGYYADIRSRYGSDDPRQYVWIAPIPVAEIQVM